MKNDIRDMQSHIANEAFAQLQAVSVSPTEGDYLTRDEAQSIVGETLLAVEDGSVEHKYLNGHRKRLIETLTVIPKASHENATFLDVGCYGYFGLWAIRHLGYRKVVGTEMPLESGEITSSKTLAIGEDSVEIEVFHFNLTEDQWPIAESFDTAICLEVLEHVDHDPSGVLCRLRDLIKPDGTLVFSVPNGVSYKTLGEFIAGMPPWTYWFYSPDLAHEPRHSLEYTPFMASLVLRAAGFQMTSFRTMDAYEERETITDLYQIGEFLGVDSNMFGETMIMTASKSEGQPPVRFPDAIYSGEGYYESTWPMINRLQRAKTVQIQSRLETLENVSQIKGQASKNPQGQFDDLRLALKKARADAREQNFRVEELTYLLNAAERRLEGTVEEHPEPEPEQNQGVLLLYRLLSPKRIQMLAERAELPAEKNWRRQLIRHPFRISEWKGLKRLLRRLERGEFREEVERSLK